MRERVLSLFGGIETPIERGAGGPAWVAANDESPAQAGLTDAAVLVPLVDRPVGMTVLLTQRTEILKSHAGQIAFPGGRMQADDGTPELTALRETEEEIGLARRHVRLLGRLETRETGSGYRVVPIVGLIAPPFALTPDPGEVADIFEVPLPFVVDPANHRFETRVQRGIERQFYAIPYGERYIWGLTARLLVNLSEMLRR
ncbi:MAG: CoA pyrophosphatase [Alphaproteobacteria bacterium]|nr:CoA pyrophosphatase [Alphaproteobacteria bacterium]